MKVAGAREGDGAIGFGHLKEAGTLNGKIEIVTGLVEVALSHDHFCGGGAGAESDLQTGRGGLLALRGTGRNHVLVDHVFKLKPAAAEACSGGVGEVVGDGVEVCLLGAHAACCCV